jgi:hypothetical protein
VSPSHHDELLDMTVVSLPKPGEVWASDLARSRVKLLSILLLCSLPVVLSYLAFYVFKPHGQAAAGELISPVRPVPSVTAKQLEGAPFALTSLRSQWLLVRADGGACVQDCQKRLLMLRQLRLMLGQNMDRVDWVWLISDQAPVDATLRAGLEKDHATVLRLDPQVLQAWLPVDEGKAMRDYIFVVDPMGNTMMRLPAVLDSAGASRAKSDLERLLRASLSWDSPGR